jgi:hypothetical protein
MNEIGENQHWFSKVLLKRHKLPEAAFECYQIETGAWEPKGIERACAWPGYNQLLIGGQADNTLEATFSGVESKMPKTFRALDHAANQQMTELPQDIYVNLCRYCAFLKLISPVAKPGAVIGFILQLNMELQNGTDHLLRELKLSEATIQGLRNVYSEGYHIVVESENTLQLLHNFQLRRSIVPNYLEFLNAHWTILRSPLQIPISDVGLIPIHLVDQKANLYLLPIGRNTLLKAFFYHDFSQNSAQPVIKTLELSGEEAEYCFDCICASAVNEIICARRIPGIPEAIARAKANGIQFHKILDRNQIISAGLKDVGTGDIRFKPVTIEEYRRFVHTYVSPLADDPRLLAAKP